ncbi:hypothetical protein QSJ19_11315 [Gordonia sp. ABSL11-1]|uniref:hypothetical protein n=1 Tax=Gordonia sp. ABSL11-1 TaxID=3053924 RepID=UPI002572AF75|nr:hypothetical protein [Gordonia sp. ABSL11-1]MDL9946174.1 hypothetical protein [Gordonia sp. ABSL11-1]
MPYSDDDLEAFYRDIEARTAADDRTGRRPVRDVGAPRTSVTGRTPPVPPTRGAAPPGLTDDDLERFYRAIENRTAAAPARRAPRRSRTPRSDRACPTPEKHAFRAENLARDGIARIRQERGVRAELRSYRCVCGSWHITSRPQR